MTTKRKDEPLWMRALMLLAKIASESAHFAVGALAYAAGGWRGVAIFAGVFAGFGIVAEVATHYTHRYLDRRYARRWGHP